MIPTPKGLCASILIAGSALATAQSQNPFSFTTVNATEEGAIRLAWQSESNTIYRVEYADPLVDPDQGIPVWKTLYDNYPSHGTNTFWLDTGNYNFEPPIPHPKYGTNRFYRIVSEGTNSGEIPFVVITSPTNASNLSGLVTVSVTATSAYPVVSTKLYVDGQEMWLSEDGTNYILNTCEWPNGPHTLFATAMAQSSLPGPSGPYPIDVGRAVSSYLPVTFSNLISKVAFSEHFFQPSLGQTQAVTAAFAANVDWTLQILDDSTSNTVRFVSGSGTSLTFNWDGTGTNGAALPDGLYNYLISAQTNGQAFSFGSGGSAPLNSSSAAAASSSENWHPRTARQALDAGLTSFFIQFPPLPPYKSNGVWVARDPQPPVEVQVSQSFQDAYSQALNAKSSFVSGGYAPEDFGGPASQTTLAPTRAPTVGVKNQQSTYGVAYYTHAATNTWAVPSYGSFPLIVKIHLEGSTSLNPVRFDPIRNVDNTAASFIQGMKKGGWALGFHRHDGDLPVHNLRRADLSIGGGEIFTQVTIGFFLGHGTYGGDPDFAPGGSGAKLTYWPSGNSGDSSSPWLRMCQFGFGGNLKWAAILACNSLLDPNFGTMVQHGAIPLKTTHLLCGTTTISYMEDNIGLYWAQNMVKKKQTIMSSWFDAGDKAYHEPHINAITNTVGFRVTGYSECFSDTVVSSTAPTNPSASPGNLVRQDQDVFHYP